MCNTSPRKQSADFGTTTWYFQTLWTWK